MEEKKEVRIGRYLSGEMTGMERESFELEMSSDPGLKAEVMATTRIWAHQPAEVDGNWDTEGAWERFSQAHGTVPAPAFVNRRRMLYWAVAAAAVLMVGVYTVFFSNGTPVTYAYQEGVSEPIVLKDGTTILLNRASSVTVYPFNGKKRHVELHGEAFFDVAPDTRRPFTVAAGETLTEVVGTSFNLKEAAGQTHIFVASGKIIFSSLQNEKMALALTEGEAAHFESSRLEMIANPSPNVNAWRTDQLRFVKMPLSSVVADVSSYFDEKITIENEDSKSCIINIPLSFKKPEISAVLKAVAASINAELIIEGETYIIRGGRSCS
jgi:transmembrane sensor